MTILYKKLRWPKEIIPVPQVRGFLLANLNKYARLIQADYAEFTATWRHRPTFLVKRHYAGGDNYVLVYTTDIIFHYLDRGTSRRYATMTRDFRPKTAYRRIKSTTGQGGLAYVNPRVARPGIEARDITIEIREKHEDAFFADTRQAIRNGLRRRTK